jgi:hypothetical protein
MPVWVSEVTVAVPGGAGHEQRRSMPPAADDDAADDQADAHEGHDPAGQESSSRRHRMLPR